MTAFAQSGNNIVSENEAAFYEIISQESENSQSVIVNLKLTPRENVKVKQVTLPDALIQEKGKAVQYTNTARIKEIPFNRAENEGVIHNISKDFYLKAETLNGDGLLSKSYRNQDIAYYVNSLHLERPTYRFIFTNKYASPLTEITLTEDGDKFDLRLFLTEMVSICNK